MATQHFTPPMPAVARILSSYDRAKVEAFVEIAIGLLDTFDGNADDEENDTEDALVLSGQAIGCAEGPGCPISDPGGTVASEDEPDFCYAQGIDGGNIGPGCPLSDPDMAVDDKGCDDINDDREPEDWHEHPLNGFSDPVARAEHRERIRATRCYRRRSLFRGLPLNYELLNESTVPTRRQLLRRKRGVPKRPRG